MAASPSDATMIESAKPTKNSRAYSTSNGMNNASNALLEYR